jgi:spermidine/putrescine-binding protein
VDEKGKAIVKFWNTRRCAVAAAFGLTLVAVGCGAKSANAPSRLLTVLIWSDYINPAVVAEFEKKHNCKIRLDLFYSNEELRKKLEEERTIADVIVPSSYALKSLDDDGYLMPLDMGKLPNRKYIDDEIVAKFLKGYSLDKVGVPYFVSPTGLAYFVANGEEKGKAPVGLIDPKAPLSWNDLGREGVEKGGTKDNGASILGERREAIAVALLVLSLDVNTSDKGELQRAKVLLQTWLQAGLRVNGRSYQYHLLAGRKALGQAYLGDVLPLEPTVRFGLPVEGYAMTCDCLAITRNTRERDLAHEFINFLTDPEVCARNMAWALYYAPNAKARRDPAIQQVKEKVAVEYLKGLWLEKGAPLLPLIAEGEQAYQDLWQELSKENKKAWEE